MTHADADAVLRIYAEGIATGIATFETEVPTWEQWHAGHLDAPRLVARDEAAVVCGWSAVAPVSSRRCYRGVVETSVYVAAAMRGRGAGRALLDGLTAAARSEGLWLLQASILAVNEASIRAHAAAGYRVVGTRERIAERDGTWHDTVLMELRL
jgi:L-amino acid N-acyltransferase YncA